MLVLFVLRVESTLNMTLFFKTEILKNEIDKNHFWRKKV